MKQTTRIARIRKSGGMFQAISVFAMYAGVPSAENTEPMNVDATSRIITMLDVCTVRNVASFRIGHVSRPCAAVTISAPTQPIAAPSVGVAHPVTMEPSVARISAAGGTSPNTNSRTRWPTLTLRSSADSGGPICGLRHTRTIV